MTLFRVQLDTAGGDITAITATNFNCNFLFCARGPTLTLEISKFSCILELTPKPATVYFYKLI